MSLARASTDGLLPSARSSPFRIGRSALRWLIMAIHHLILGAAAACLLSSCSSDESTTKAEPTAAEKAGQQMLQESIAAHGGIEKWHNNGLLMFRWQYHMTDKDKIVDTISTVDPTTMAVAHTVPGSTTMFGMNDGKAWIFPADAEFTPPPRFWALTPFYFMGIPFVFDDPSATATLLDETIKFEGRDWPQVKITYSEDAGDSPDDYYVLLIDPTTKVTRAAYYTVTHPLVFEGGTPVEKLITLDGLKDVNGTMLPHGHITYSMTDGLVDHQMRHTRVSGVQWIDRDKADLSVPEKAQILD